MRDKREGTILVREKKRKIKERWNREKEKAGVIKATEREKTQIKERKRKKGEGDKREKKKRKKERWKRDLKKEGR